jgi:hypothetical protein
MDLGIYVSSTAGTGVARRLKAAESLRPLPCRSQLQRKGRGPWTPTMPASGETQTDGTQGGMVRLGWKELSAEPDKFALPAEHQEQAGRRKSAC